MYFTFSILIRIPVDEYWDNSKWIIDLAYVFKCADRHIYWQLNINRLYMYYVVCIVQGFFYISIYRPTFCIVYFAYALRAMPRKEEYAI